MKKKLWLFAASLGFALSAAALVGCATGTNPPSVPKDYNADIQTVAPENISIEHFVAEENTTYYTSQGFSLWMEVNGHFLEMDYFSLDGNKRVYDNLYLYEDDYFYMVTDDYKDLYAALGDSTDAEYAETETQDGYDVQVNVKKSGIYKLLFDVDTLKFDMEYKSEIQTPVYYTMKNCSIFSLATNWVEMNVNPDNPEEFMIENFHVEEGKDISFYNHLHTSNYKVTLNEDSNDTYASARKTIIKLNVGGDYNVYVNAKTYVARLELLNPETASYSCVYYDGTDFIPLQPYDNAIPYVFRQRIVVDEAHTNVPKFHTKNYKTYRLKVVESDALTGSGKYYYFKQPGTYDIIINLKTFELSVELLPE